jgi:hypothetical protein
MYQMIRVKPLHLEGGTDDTVMALAIAAEVYRTHQHRLSTDRVGFESVFIPERQTNWI